MDVVTVERLGDRAPKLRRRLRLDVPSISRGRQEHYNQDKANFYVFSHGDLLLHIQKYCVHVL